MTLDEVIVDLWAQGIITHKHPAHTVEIRAAILAFAAEQVAVECNSTDNLLTLLGLAPEQCRTDGGSLNPRKVMTLLNERRRPKGGAWADRKDGFWLGDDAAIRARAQEE